MFTKTTVAAALISLTTLAAVPAQASDITVQIGFGGPGYGWNVGHGHGNDYGYRHHRRMRDLLSPDEVRWMLRDRGYSDIRFFDNSGALYQLRAWRHGERYVLAVSARTGEILSRYAI
jgi:hypothetical protein